MPGDETLRLGCGCLSLPLRDVDFESLICAVPCAGATGVAGEVVACSRVGLVGVSTGFGATFCHGDETVPSFDLSTSLALCSASAATCA